MDDYFNPENLTGDKLFAYFKSERVTHALEFALMNALAAVGIQKKELCPEIYMEACMRRLATPEGLKLLKACEREMGKVDGDGKHAQELREYMEAFLAEVSVDCHMERNYMQAQGIEAQFDNCYTTLAIRFENHITYINSDRNVYAKVAKELLAPKAVAILNEHHEAHNAFDRLTADMPDGKIHEKYRGKPESQFFHAIYDVVSKAEPGNIMQELKKIPLGPELAFDVETMVEQKLKEIKAAHAKKYVADKKRDALIERAVRKVSPEIRAGFSKAEFAKQDFIPRGRA